MSKKRKTPKTELSMNSLRESMNRKKPKKESSTESQSIVSFPLDVFPRKIQDIITNWHQANKLPIDFYGLGVLTVCGAVVGNAYKLKYKNGQLYSPVLYSCVVGNPSIGKTPALNLTLKPIMKIESRFQKEFEENKERWEIENEQSKKKEHSEKPKRQDILLNDATVESICQAHQSNQRGLLCYYDEMKGFMDNQNKYRSGGDIQFWLSVWSGSNGKVNRASKDTIYIESPSIAIIGGTQPSVLKKLVGKDNKDNGFLYRFLFVFPANMKKPHDTDVEIDERIDAEYDRIVNQIFEMGGGINGFEQHKISMTHEAKKTFRDWKNKLTDETNESHEDSVKSLYGKLESYCLRFALVLHILELVCDKNAKSAEGTTVSKPTIEKAIRLTAYFKGMGLKVLDEIEINDPFNGLPDDFKKCYAMLPEIFTTKEGVSLAEKHNIPERTFKRYLSKYTQLFIRENRGKYKKLL